MYRALLLTVLIPIVVVFSSIAPASDTLSLIADPQASPSPFTTRAVGIKKVGYQIRAWRGNFIPISMTEPPSLSSPFWDRPFVLSLQRKPNELQH